jgi:uncharacterized Zn finger protein (UPF0148 family)
MTTDKCPKCGEPWFIHINNGGGIYGPVTFKCNHGFHFRGDTSSIVKHLAADMECPVYVEIDITP